GGFSIVSDSSASFLREESTASHISLKSTPTKFIVTANNSMYGDIAFALNNNNSLGCWKQIYYDSFMPCLLLGKVNISEALVPEVMILLENVRRKWFIGALPFETSAKNHVSDDSQLDQPAYIGKCVATEPDTSSCNLHDRSARRSRAQVQRSRDGASGASTATKCSLAQKRPCGILTGLLTSGGLEFGKCYSLPALSGPRIDNIFYPNNFCQALKNSGADVGYGAKAEVLGQVRGRYVLTP
ncbi:hypothetical protein Tco_1271179, partial [Tanacetum coccineum]